MEVGDFIIITVVLVLMAGSTALTFDFGTYQQNVVQMLCQASVRYALDGNPLSTIDIYKLENKYPSLQQIRLPGGDPIDAWYSVTVENDNGPINFGMGRYRIVVNKLASAYMDIVEQKFYCNDLVPMPQGVRKTPTTFFDTSRP